VFEWWHGYLGELGLISKIIMLEAT